ncbi:RNA-binding protein YlmH, contains S4-like domain [Desulfotomaculum arcticum]|uniref:RNA-binding protein YlmH, contains S4-like domain n=1 Tax=Desulfotruncus arcticus DSM 17038 TaxID=1121424 RepID=A0A1I2T1A6_9FIRM|nr:YlmH/Sll1252 family protein [Desulfotruncus arcticus]SFG56206.1 RNA-binding protein YlmH, contains S4-like domain [Desulfotomaculum arcticum] [Desulfotruncus arcticus DSM 17038]
MNRNKLLDAAVTPEERETLARVLDLAEIVLKTHRTQYADFNDPYRCGLIARTVEAIPGLTARVDGGYPAAERARVLISPDYLPEAPEDGLVFLEIKGNFRFKPVTHRDYLGALMGMGIRREKLGDILVNENGAHIIVAKEIADYIKSGLTAVGRTGVSVREMARTDLELPEREYREIKTTVQSMRIDAVAAHGFGLSRSKMAGEITSGKIFLNWRPCLDPSAGVNAGDMISARGRGRVEVIETGGKTKKGRLGLLLRRY